MITETIKKYIADTYEDFFDVVDFLKMDPNQIDDFQYLFSSVDPNNLISTLPIDELTYNITNSFEHNTFYEVTSIWNTSNEFLFTNYVEVKAINKYTFKTLVLKGNFTDNLVEQEDTVFNLKNKTCHILDTNNKILKTLPLKKQDYVFLYLIPKFKKMIRRWVID